MRVAPAITLTEEQEHALKQWARGRSLAARLVERARLVLLAAAGKQDLEIAAELGITIRRPHAGESVS
jgi:DNA-binding CsgD family transcriptional regulator